MSSSIVKSNVKRKCQQQQQQSQQQQQQKATKNKFINKQSNKETGTTINTNNNNNKSKIATTTSSSSNDMCPKDISSIDDDVDDMLPGASGAGVGDNCGGGITDHHSIQLTTACKSIVDDNQSVAVATIQQLPSSSNSSRHNIQKASNKNIKNNLIGEMIKDVSKTINNNISTMAETETETAMAAAAVLGITATMTTTTVLLPATSSIHEHDYDYNVVVADDDVVGVFPTGAVPIAGTTSSVYRKGDASKKLTVITTTTPIVVRTTTATVRRPTAMSTTAAMKGESNESKLTTMKKKIATATAIQKPTIKRLQNYLKQDIQQSESQSQSPETTATKLIRRTTTTTRTATTTVKSKSKTENKCAYELPTIFSNQRKLEANRTREHCKFHDSNGRTNKWISKQQQQHIVDNTKLLNQCEPLEYVQLQDNYKELQATATAKPKVKDNKRILSLAERKAKLKSDFFKDIKIKDNKVKTNTVKVLATSKGNSKQPTTPKVAKRLWPLRKSSNSNLRLNKTKDFVAATAAAPSAVTITAPTRTVLPVLGAAATTTITTHEPPLSLVAQRKLDLKEKFAQQTSTKISVTTSNKPSIVYTSSSPAPPRTNNDRLSSRVEHLVQKFDKKLPPQRKMIVNPNKIGAEENAATASSEMNVNVILLKPLDSTLEQRNSPLSDEGCNLGQSPYSSDDNDEDNVSIRTASTAIELPSLLLHQRHKDKVARSASSDSALGLELLDDATMMDIVPSSPPQSPPSPTEQPQQQRRMTLTVTDLPLRPALLPLAEPTALPDTPILADMQQAAAVQNLITQTAIPSKVLLEERVIELPEDPRCNSLVGGLYSLSSSRRESAQSCGSDYGVPTTECISGRRFVRTPSVVVSDYSDDVMCGITLEEIEYFRAQRMRRRHSSLDTAGTGTEKEGDAQSDVSAASSCSNLYYCGSTISALDGAECYINGQRMHLERKTSDCSTCSVSGGEEADDGFTITEQPEELSKNYQLNTGVGVGVAVCKDLSDLLAAQHLSSKRAKKVGLVGMGVPGGEKTGF